MKKILLSQKTVLILLIVFVLLGGGGLVKFFLPLQDKTQNYDLDLVRSADPVFINEVSKKPRLVIVNFWASWCPPCIQETPSMLNFAKKYADDIQFYMVSEDSSSKEIRDFLRAFSDVRYASLRVIWDANRKIGQNFKVYKMPETFIFNREGKLLRQLSGSLDWSQPEFDKIIAEHFQN